MSEPYGEPVLVGADQPRIRAAAHARSAGSSSAVSIWAAAGLLPGVRRSTSTGAAFAPRRPSPCSTRSLPPVLAALRLPFMLAVGFLLVLVADALLLLLARRRCCRTTSSVDSFGDALLAALLIVGAVGDRARRSIVGDQRRRRVHAARHPADRAPPGRRARAPTSRASSSSRSTGSRCRCCATRCATAARRRWRAGSPTTATGWPSGRPTCRRRPAPARPGILLGSNEDIPAFRWVEKESGRMIVCSSPADCAEIERRHATGIGLLADGGASRGNLLSGEADETILTVSRIEAEKRAEPGLPRVPRQRLQRHARARAVRLGGRARVDRRRCARRAATSGRAATAAASIR